MMKTNAFYEEQWYLDLKDQGVERRYATGDVINFQGEVISKVGFVVTGSAQAIAYSAHGRQTWIGKFSEGDFLGLTSILTQNASRFELTARKALRVLEMPPSLFQALMSRHESFIQAVQKDLSQRQNFYLDNIINVNTLSVKGRICVELLKLAKPVGIDPSKQVIRPNPVIIDLARRLNSTRETVSRTVSELQGKGILTRHPGALMIERPKRLRESIEYI